MGSSKKLFEQQKLEDQAREEQSKSSKNTCSATGGVCKYGSIITSIHPCKVSGKIKLQCKHLANE